EVELVAELAVLQLRRSQRHILLHQLVDGAAQRGVLGPQAVELLPSRSQVAERVSNAAGARLERRDDARRRLARRIEQVPAAGEDGADRKADKERQPDQGVG